MREYEETVYSPESALRRPATLIGAMRSDLRRALYIAWRIFLRDLNARYRQTYLGYLWAFVPPLVVAAGFTWAGEQKLINVGPTALPYPAYVILGMVLWQTFAEAVSGPVQAIAESAAVLARVNFPREAIVLAKLWDVLFGFAVKSLLVVGVFVWYRLPLGAPILLAPLALFMLVLLGIAIGTVLAPLAALYQDFSRGLTALLGVWLLLTPVVYPSPTGEGAMATLVRANPVTPLLVTVRELATSAPLTMAGQFVAVSAAVAAALLLAWVGYRVAMPYVIERLGG